MTELVEAVKIRRQQACCGDLLSRNDQDVAWQDKPYLWSNQNVAILLERGSPNQLHATAEVLEAGEGVAEDFRVGAFQHRRCDPTEIDTHGISPTFHTRGPYVADGMRTTRRNGLSDMIYSDIGIAPISSRRATKLTTRTCDRPLWTAGLLSRQAIDFADCPSGYHRAASAIRARIAKAGVPNSKISAAITVVGVRSPLQPAVVGA